MGIRSFSTMLPSVKFAEDRVHCCQINLVR